MYIQRIQRTSFISFLFILFHKIFFVSPFMYAEEEKRRATLDVFLYSLMNTEQVHDEANRAHTGAAMNGRNFKTTKSNSRSCTTPSPMPVRIWWGNTHNKCCCCCWKVSSHRTICGYSLWSSRRRRRRHRNIVQVKKVKNVPFPAFYISCIRRYRYAFFLFQPRVQRGKKW